MDAKFMHKSVSKDAPAVERIDSADGSSATEPAGAGRACCCAARPAVRVTMPADPSRRHSTELLLCGHHYRVSRHALAAARATVRELPGTPSDVASWIGVR